mgnify:CR=1 FL=1
MLDLEPMSGLPMRLDDSGELLFDPDIVVDEAKVRLFNALTPVALDPESCRGNEDVAYYMYNGVYQKRDAETLSDVPMRYELTMMPAKRMGRELVKTFGHRHCVEPESGLDYTEVCEVLLGTAHFVFQNLDLDGPRASFALCVEAGPGQKVLAPPGFEHCTINPGPGPLLFSDVIALGVSGIYEKFKASRGAAYLEVVEDGDSEFIPNPTYEAVPPLQSFEPRDYPEVDLTRELPLYRAFVDGSWEDWEFLAHPRKFWPTFPELKPVFGL